MTTTMDGKDYQPGANAQVSTHSAGGQITLMFVREMRHSPEKVWPSLTIAERIPQWAPYKPNRDLTGPGPAVLTMVDGSSPENYASEVRQTVPEQVLEYSWGESLLRWELTPNRTGSTLTLHHSVPNPEWISPAAAGWHICLDIAELLLDGNDIEPSFGRAAADYCWARLVEEYTEALGR